MLKTEQNKKIKEEKASSKEQKKNTGRQPLTHSVGRRKKAVARIWLRRGTGKIVVNNKDHTKYFDTNVSILSAATPFRVCPIGTNYNVQVIVRGGGKEAQADAVKLGIARALVNLDSTLRPALRKYKLLTVDSRQVERKKYGQRGARRKFQFVKR